MTRTSGRPRCARYRRWERYWTGRSCEQETKAAAKSDVQGQTPVPFSSRQVRASIKTLSPPRVGTPHAPTRVPWGFAIDLDDTPHRADMRANKPGL
jgi:hypothetical protein